MGLAYTLSGLPLQYQYTPAVAAGGPTVHEQEYEHEHEQHHRLPHSPPSSSSVARDQSQLTEPSYQSRELRSARRSSSSDLLARPFPVVQTISPTEGPPGTQVAVYLCAVYDLDRPPVLRYSLMFGTQSCAGSLTKLDSQGPFYRYLLPTTAPAITTAGWASPDVPLGLRIDDDTGQYVGAVEVGRYTYTPPPEPGVPVYRSPPVRKRKSSADLEPLAFPPKRFSHQHSRSASGDEMPTFAYTAMSGELYRPYAPLDGAGPRPPTVMAYAPSPSPADYGSSAAAAAVVATTRPLSYPYVEAPVVPVTTPELRASRPPSWSSAYSDVSSQASHSPALTAVAASVRATSSHHPSPSGSTMNPTLIRTSTIPPSANVTGSLVTAGAAGPVMVGPGAGPAFNPYAMYPHKAVLKLQGDLDGMADHWSVHEWESKRRLVQFQRRQSGSTIHATFHPISPEERAANSICISCIWWEEKNECYVTSVDTIYLLESLVAVRFTVEEKNRIRRNLEGFRPLTVSKGKPDSEEFFKVIMGFPAPKPRNIEKDVKVFPWKILAPALKKIIGKYSASYSSTASALGQPGSSFAYSGPPGGPSSNAMTMAGMANPDYHTGIASPATSLSPSLSHPTAPLSSASASLTGGDMRLAVPQLAPHRITSSPRAPTYVDDGVSGPSSWSMGSYGGPDLAPANTGDLLIPSTAPPGTHV